MTWDVCRVNWGRVRTSISVKWKLSKLIDRNTVPKETSLGAYMEPINGGQSAEKSPPNKFG